MQFYLLFCLITFFIFFLFIIIISLFGFIFYYYLEKINGKEWGLNFFEKFFISFGIGISLFISFSFILIIFKFFNFFSAYLSIILIDILFICNLVYRKDITKTKILNFFTIIKINFSRNRKHIIILICILIIIFLLQFTFQWSILTYQLSFLDNDPFAVLGNTLSLIDYGFIKSFGPIYPPGYTIFTAGFLLIFPNFKITYFFIKFVGIFFLSFYLLVITIILYRLFKKKYIIFLGLIMCLTSHYLIYRFNQYLSSNISTLLLLISLIILISNCPDYFLGFFISAIYLINPIIGFYYIITLFLFILIKAFYINKNFKIILVKSLKTFIITCILLIPYFLLLFSCNFTFFDFINQYLEYLGFSPISISTNQLGNNRFLLSIDLLDIKKIILEEITDWFPEGWLKALFIKDQILFSFFFIFALMSLLIPIRPNLKDKKCNLIIFGKVIIILILILFYFPVFFPELLIISVDFYSWVAFRSIECFSGPIIIMICFIINVIIKKSKKLTNYFLNRFSGYRINTFIKKSKKLTDYFLNRFSGCRNYLFKKKILSKFLNFKNLLIATLLISFSINYYIKMHLNNDYPYLGYHFNREQINSIFFVKENIPNNSKILVPDLSPTRADLNCLYFLLYDYDYYLWNLRTNNSYIEIKNYLIQNNISYLLLNLELISPFELNYFYMNDIDFKVLYENDRIIIFEYNTESQNWYKVEGIYNAPWNFINMDTGISNLDIDFINWASVSTDCSLQIITEKIGHRKVLELYDNNSNGNSCGVHFFSLTSTPGTVEFWWSMSDTRKNSFIDLIYYNGSKNIDGIKIRINNSFFQYYNSLEWVSILSASNNTWYHIRLDFKCVNGKYMGLSNNSFNWYINNVLEASVI